MTTDLFSLKIKSKRDVLVVRLRARQLTRLLGFAEQDQVLLAASAFELAWGAYQSRGRVVLHFVLDDERLRVHCSRPERKEEEEERKAFDRAWNGPGGKRRKPKPAPVTPFAELALRLEIPLPSRPGPVAMEDVAWSMEQLAGHTPLNLFAEIQQYNLELLRLSSEQRGRDENEGKRRRAGAAA